MFDIPIVRINGMNNGNLEQQKQFNIQFGLLSSALEHATPEMMFTNAQNPGEAISAVKALQKANAAGQKIYHITQANMASVLPNIHHNAKTKEEIQNALNAGKEVITHTDAVSVPGWSGAGYIILDSVTGDGAYKIGGGANGGDINVNENASPLMIQASIMPDIGSLLKTLGGVLFGVFLKLYGLYEQIKTMLETCGNDTALLYSGILLLTIMGTIGIGGGILIGISGMPYALVIGILFSIILKMVLTQIVTSYTGFCTARIKEYDNEIKYT